MVVNSILKPRSDQILVPFGNKPLFKAPTDSIVRSNNLDLQCSGLFCLTDVEANFLPFLCDCEVFFLGLKPLATTRTAANYILSPVASFLRPAAVTATGHKPDGCEFYLETPLQPNFGSIWKQGTFQGPHGLFRQKKQFRATLKRIFFLELR